MSAHTPAAPIPAHRPEPPWWVVLLAIPLFLTSVGFAVVAGIAGVSNFAGVTVSRDSTASTPLAGGGVVTIKATGAGVRIAPGPEGVVSVEDRMEVRSITRALARTALDGFTRSRLTSTDGGVTVEVQPQQFDFAATRIDRHVTIRLPAGAAVRFSGSAAAAEIEDLDGPLDLDVTSGAIRLIGVVVRGDDRIAATSGAVDFEGSVESGRLEIETTSGAINVRLPRGTNASYDVSATNGAIFIQPECGSPLVSAGGTRARTGVLGSGGSASIVLRAVSGAVSLQVGPAPKRHTFAAAPS